jgi:triacylglycerol lipase
MIARGHGAEPRHRPPPPRGARPAWVTRRHVRYPLHVRPTRHCHRARAAQAVTALLVATVASLAGCRREAQTLGSTAPHLRPPVVLLHGLTNKHPWSEAFLAECLEAWGDGRVYLVYTNTRAAEREIVRDRLVGRRTVVVAGTDNPSAGDESVLVQSRYVDESVRRLQASHGLPRRFAIIAHSMGGLVARHYIDMHPDTVVGLVTLGTPHHGSPLAEDFRWAALFLGAREAIVDLTPARCEAFNKEHPAASARLAEGARIFTVRGAAHGSDAFGAYGELRLGSALLSERHHLSSDGLVPENSALLAGATHLADFPDLDHYRLVRDPRVARKAADALP